MSQERPIRGHRKLELLRDLAARELTHAQLAEKYEAAVGTIGHISSENKASIQAMREDAKNEMHSLWIAQSVNRIAEYQAQVEMVNAELDRGEINSKNIRTAQIALRSVAEEVGDLKTNVSVDPLTVNYKVEGVDPEAMK